MPTPLPNPQSLLAALNTLERTLADFEKAREAGPKFSRSSSDNKVTVVANALGRFMSVQIEQDQLTLGAAALAVKVRDVANLAVDAAYAATRAAFASFASTLSIPGLPAYGSLPPDYADFVPTAASIEADILANNPCESTKTFTCSSGPVTVVVNSKRRVVSLTYPTPLPRFAVYLAAHTLQALNCGVDDADPIPDPTPGIPTSLGLHELAIFGKGTVKLNDRVKVKGLNCTGWGNVGNRGTVETNIGVEAEVGKLASRARVILRDRGKVHGFLITSDVLERHNQTVIDGLIFEHSTVLLPDLVLNVPFPGVTVGTIELEPGQQQTAGPGYYDKCHPKQNAQVFLSTGVYYFNEFFLEPGSKVWLSQTSGPVVIYVKNAFTFRGSFMVNGGAFPRVFVGYLGTSMAVVENAYKGTLSAPNAKISISTIQNHEGAFHGKDVEAQPDNQICHRPFELHYEQLPGIVPPGGLPQPVVDLGFENVAGWSSPQSALLTQVTTPVTQGTKSLRVSNPPGTTEIVSANFSANLAPQGCTRVIVDVFVPTNQPNGTVGVVISVPSANVNNVSLGTVSTTGRPTNQFGQFEFALPTAVRTALDGAASDVSIKVVLGVAAFSGPWFIDNIRFLGPPPALSTLDPILSFEDTSKWTCAQVGLTSSTTVKTHLTKSLKVNTAPGAMTIVSAAFATGALSAPSGKFRIDLRKPSQSGTNHGTFSVQFDIPSAGISNVSTASVAMTPLAANAFAQVELDLPGNVKLAVNGEYGDMRVKLIVNAVSGTGPWHFDNIRFV
jgi:hypothetical protein